MRRNGTARWNTRLTGFRRCCYVLAILALKSASNLASAADSNDEIDPAESEIKQYNSSATMKKGFFYSINYPNPYPKNHRVVYQFRAATDEVVWIEWNDFVLDEPKETKLCQSDYIEVIVIDYNDVQRVIRRFCGSKLPPSFKTMQQSVDIIFQSSYSNQSRGFNGSFSFIHEKELPAPKSKHAGVENPAASGCGGILQGTYGGVIKSPGFPDFYPANVECNWVIRVQTGKKVYVRILELQLTASKTECDQAQLLVMDGYAHYIYDDNTSFDKNLIRFCGEDKYYKEEGARSYVSTNNRMVVRFSTSKPPPKQMYTKHDDHGYPVGFYLVWTEVFPVDDKNDKAQCDKFLCRGGDYCIDEAQTVCADRRRYCIDRSLLCDGIPNCAEHDDSDEENCYSKEIVAAGASLFLLLVVVIVSVVCCQSRGGKRQLQQFLRLTRMRSTTPSSYQMNAGNNTGRSSSEEDTQLLRSGAEKFSVSARDLTAFPQNYHPARGGASPAEDLRENQPFLSNHVGVPSSRSAMEKAKLLAASATVESKPPEKPRVAAAAAAAVSATVNSGVRRRNGSTSTPRIPLIKVMSAPESGDVWEEQGSEGYEQQQQQQRRQRQQKIMMSKSSGDEQPPKPAVYSGRNAPIRQPVQAAIPAVFEQEANDGEEPSTAGSAMEMVTFNPNKPARPPKPQGILKSSTLPSTDQEPPGFEKDVVSPPAPPPPPVLVQTTTGVRKPQPPNYNQTLMRLGRQKAVEFAEELPKRHETSQPTPPPPPPPPAVAPALIMLSPPGQQAEQQGEQEDRSPSPWHRITPSMV